MLVVPRVLRRSGRVMSRWERTGGFSSSCFSPRSGFAFKFAKTPSLEEAKVE